MLKLIMDFISDLFDIFFNILFIIYIIVLVGMAVSAPGYLFWELVALTIGYIIYKAKGKSFCRTTTFREVWMSATMSSVLCFILGPTLGLILSPIARLCFVGFAYR